MIARTALPIAVFALAGCSSAPVTTTVAPVTVTAPQRAIRRDIPLTNTIRRAFAAGTRDSTGRPGRNYWQQWMDYTIRARLDVPTNTVTGHETVVLHNNSDSTLRNVVLRLDQNYFAPNAARIEALPSTIEVTQGMKVTRLTLNGQQVAASASQPRRGSMSGPTAFNLDQSVAVIALQNPIPAKGSATLEVDWNFEVPAVSEGRGQRMGRLADTLYQVAQWYPRVAMYDDLRGWDTEPYLGNAEFYNNFGHWDVSLDVPAGWLVGATGILQNPEAILSPVTRERMSHVLASDATTSIVGASEMGAGRATAAGDRLVWRFVADTAGDFAWATSKSYMWDATRATIPGRGAVPVNLFYLPGDSATYKQTAPVTRHALEFYSKLWMPYAFPQLTVTDGPELGMEYPMFIMSGLEAADHETGHEWWPMTVGVNETWYGWMDEGFNQYMNILSDADREGHMGDLNGVGQAYGRVSGTELESPMMWPANYQGALYGFTTYGKAPQMLSALGGVVGDSAVWRAMSEYAKAWRFKHPSPWDYMFFMQNALGRDLGWFWNYWLFTTETVNESIQSVGSLAGGPTTVVVRQDGQMPAPVVLRVKFAATGGPITPMQNAVMTDATTALVTWPVDVWFNGSRTFTANLDFGGRPIESIALDPDRRFPDNNPRDNVWPR
jgi:hypothetical protein